MKQSLISSHFTHTPHRSLIIYNTLNDTVQNPLRDACPLRRVPRLKVVCPWSFFFSAAELITVLTYLLTYHLSVCPSINHISTALQHSTLVFLCNCLQNIHMAASTAEPIIPASFGSWLTWGTHECHISTPLLDTNCIVLIINHNRKPYFTTTDRVQCGAL